MWAKLAYLSQNRLQFFPLPREHSSVDGFRANQIPKQVPFHHVRQVHVKQINIGMSIDRNSDAQNQVWKKVCDKPEKA